MSTTLSQGFPSQNAPFVDPNTGLINRPWLILLMSLYARTGSAPGSSSSLSEVLAVGDDYDTSQAAEAASSLEFAGDDNIQSVVDTSLALGDDPAVATADPDFIMSDSTDTVLVDQLAILVGDEDVAQADASALVFSTDPELPTSGMPGVVTPGASPYTYTAPTRGSIYLAGGTVSLIEVSRDGATFYPTGQTAGVFQLILGDQLRVTYTVVPTTFVLFPN